MKNTIIDLIFCIENPLNPFVFAGFGSDLQNQCFEIYQKNHNELDVIMFLENYLKDWIQNNLDIKIIVLFFELLENNQAILNCHYATEQFLYEYLLIFPPTFSFLEEYNFKNPQIQKLVIESLSCLENEKGLNLIRKINEN